MSAHHQNHEPAFQPLGQIHGHLMLLTLLEFSSSLYKVEIVIHVNSETKINLEMKHFNKSKIAE